MNNNDFIIWAAGFFDGEGCITFNKKKYINKHGIEKCYRSLIISVSQVEPEPINMFFDFFKGGIRSHSLNKNNRKQYEFRATGENAITVLNTIIPYLVVKKDQALLAMRFSVADIAEKKNIVEKISNLKRGIK